MTENSAGVGPVERGVRPLVERLYFLASGQDDPHSVALIEAGDTIASLAGLVAELEKWHEEGERLIDRQAELSVMFRLGAWWADRPWRRRPNAGVQARPSPATRG